tara:strand:- start:22 stop:867 length:846 start_codon:yes stop_codon:yes gene_type:complete
MNFVKIKSYAKINIALNVIGKHNHLHKIESIIVFAALHDDIFIKKIKSDDHIVSFKGKFSKNIGNDNTIFKLLKELDKRKLLKKEKFRIQVYKRIPNKAGLGGGSMNAANILKYFVKKKIIKTNKREISLISRSISSDMILGLNSRNSILTSKNVIKYFSNYKKFYMLIVKPNFGCSTKLIYSKVRKFCKPKFNVPSKKMFNLDFLKKMQNSLEPIVLSSYPKLRSIKLYLDSLSEPIFVRMTGSGSALVAYFKSKESCDKVKKMFNKKYKNYWSMTSKTI